MKQFLILVAVLSMTVVILLTGCALNKLPAYNTPEWNNVYSGGKGDSTENAIVINISNQKKAVDSEYHYIYTILNYEGKKGAPELQAVYKKNSRWYDVIYVKLESGEKMEFHFDFTKAHDHTLKQQKYFRY